MTVLIEKLKVSRKPIDLDTGIRDGSGTLEVTAAEWQKGFCLNCEIRATGDYASWPVRELKIEAAYMLAN